MIEVEGVTKSFVLRKRTGRLRRERVDMQAVRDLSFKIAPGEIVGYLGPNGAGKSTTIKMLVGILVPTAGHIRVLDLDPSRQSLPGPSGRPRKRENVWLARLGGWLGPGVVWRAWSGMMLFELSVDADASLPPCEGVSESGAGSLPVGLCTALRARVTD